MRTDHSEANAPVSTSIGNSSKFRSENKPLSESNERPIYDTYNLFEANQSGYRVKVVRDFEDMAKVFAIRGSACLTDIEHLYDKHFDGNDFSSTHLLGFIDGEPVGTIRIRYFADFVRIERLTVRPTHRKSRISFRLAKAAFEWCRDKGYKTVGGVARGELIPFWTMLGFRLTEGKDPVYIYGLPHFDITLKLQPAETSIKHETDTMVLLRAEGRWHEAGHHETINVTKPTDVTEPPPMVLRARRPSDLASKLSGSEKSKASFSSDAKRHKSDAEDVWPTQETPGQQDQRPS
jgi:GNAT superfamily N-acetyltransferase